MPAPDPLSPLEQYLGRFVGELIRSNISVISIDKDKLEPTFLRVVGDRANGHRTAMKLDMWDLNRQISPLTKAEHDAEDFINHKG